MFTYFFHVLRAIKINNISSIHLIMHLYVLQDNVRSSTDGQSTLYNKEPIVIRSLTVFYKFLQENKRHVRHEIFKYLNYCVTGNGPNN